MHLAPWTAGATSLLLSTVFIALLLRRTFQLPIDLPNDRSLHSKAIPRAGGLGLVPAACVGWFATSSFPWLIALLTAILAAVSYLDDRHGLPVRVRITFHIAVAVIFACSVEIAGGWISILIVALVVAWSINLYNFMDGADGLAGGMAFFGFGCLGVAALLKGDIAIAALNFSVAGSAAGFLLFNFPPAKIFLGDTGSVPLGFLAGAFGWSGSQAHLWPWWFPVLVFSPFVVDATVTLLRRGLTGQKVWKPHKEHYYQRLVRMGLGHLRTTIAEYVLMAAAGGSAILLLYADPLVQGTAIALWIVAYIACMVTIDIYWRDKVKMDNTA